MSKKHPLKLVTTEDWDELIDGVTHNAGSEMEDDQKTSIAYTENMQSVSKDLLDARLETIEVRMDARMTRIEELIGDTRHEIGLMRQESKSIRTTMIVTGISSVLAIVLGVGAFNATVLSNMVASFESGKNTASMQAALTEATKALEAATAKSLSATQQAAPSPASAQSQQ